MRVVAIRANNLTFTKGVVRYFFTVRTLVFVAAVADFCLCFFGQNRVSRLVHFMAVVARNTIVLVLCAVPVGAVATLVASQALGCTLFVVSEWEGPFLEDDVGGRATLDSWVTLQMLFACAVARLAVWSAGISSNAVFGLVDRQNGRCLALVVALGALSIFIKRCLRLGSSVGASAEIGEVVVWRCS